MSMILVGVFLLCAFIGVLYWMSSSSKRRGYHSEKTGHETRLKLKRKQEMMKDRARAEEYRRRLRGFRGWRRR